MEGTPLSQTLGILAKPDPLPSLTDELTISVILHLTNDPEPITLEGLAPFHTIEDISNAIWLKQGLDDELFPKYTFLATEVPDEPGMFTPAIRTWYSGEIEDESTWVKLGNPVEVISRRKFQEAFVDAAGELKSSIRSVPRGRTTIESAYLIDGGTLPVFHCFSFTYLSSKYTGTRPLDARSWFGLLYPYFPTIPNKVDYTLTDGERSLATQLKTVIEAKLKQMTVIEAILQTSEVDAKIRTTAVKKLYFSWKKPVTGFEGVDVLFYGTPVNEVRPFMRLLTSNTIPLTKLYQPDRTKPPMVHDTTLLRTWVSERAPDSALNVLFIKALVRAEQLGTLPLYATIRVNDDATADFTVQPPRAVRVLDFAKDLGALGQVMIDSTSGLPFSAQDAVMDHADITVELDFGVGKVAPRDIRKTVLDRLASLGTLFQPVVPPTEETRVPLICLRYKGVANFVTQDRIFSYLTFIFQRTGFDPSQFRTIREGLAKEFEMSLDEAEKYIQDYITKKEELTVSDPEAKEITALNNAGTDIAIYSQSVSSFVFHMYNIQSTKDLQRITSILGVVFTASKEDWAEATGEAVLPDEEAVAAAVAVADSASRNDEISANLFEDDGAAAAPVTVEAAPTVREAAEAAAVATTGTKPKTAIKVVKAAAVEPKAKPGAPAAPKGEQKIVSFQYLIDRLKRLDPVLFNFKSQPGIRVYSSQCGSVDDRQPAVFTQEEYNRIRYIYRSDEAEDKVGFIEYGVPDTEKQDRDAKGKREQITVLRYGSNPGAPNFFICSDYLCLRDVLPILKEDFLGTKDRNGAPKEAKSCPFCGGKQIKDPSKPVPAGETVLKRADRPKGDRPHLFVGFLKGQHPQGYDLPCCFALKKNISWSDPKFKLMRDAAKKAIASAAENVENDDMFEDEEAQEELTQSLKLRVQQLIPFEQFRYRIGKEYILGPEKFPLDVGKVGLPSLAIDSYFAQDSTKMVERPSVKMEFTANAKGFFRLGVFNQAAFTSQSLFAALAPYLGKTSPAEVAGLFTQLITPRIFINLNFGNLLLEFFDPSYPLPPRDILNKWALVHLGIDNPETELEMSRFYRSYHKFMEYIQDPTQQKQMRHFVHALAEPGVITKNGIKFITLEYLSDPREPSTQIEVSCPIMGLDVNRFSNNDVGFITHSPTGVWEPLVYIDRVVKKETVTREKEGYYLLTKYELEDKTDAKIPEAIRKRYVEFEEKCASSYRGAFTFQSSVDNRTLIPVTRAIEMLRKNKDIKSTGIKPSGILRDAFNHLVGLTIKDPYSSSDKDIIVPVVDDGTCYHNNTDLRIHVGVQSISLASADVVARFYKEVIDKLFTPISSIYKITQFIKTVEIIAFQLGDKTTLSSIRIPCRPPVKSSVEKTINGIPIIEEDKDKFEFEYMINRKLIFSNREDTWQASPYILARDQTEDLYQHIRLSFANWIAGHPEGAEMRKRLDQLLENNDIPSYEKMRRLQLEYTPLIQSWLLPDPDYKTPEFSLLRRDCISIDTSTNEKQCSGYCKTQDGTCKIHVPEKVQLGSRHRVDAGEYFSLRLFDEIIRIPARRYELMTRAVKRFQVPRTNIHVGKEWILPENVPAWYELIRETTTTTGREVPRWYEEFSREPDSEEKFADLMKKAHLVNLPETLKAVLPPETADELVLRILGRPEDNGVKVLMRYFGMGNYRGDKKLDEALLSKISQKYNNIIAVNLDISKTPISAEAYVFYVSSLKSTAIVMIPEYEEGPAIMVLKNTLSEVIPVSYLRGTILQEIKRHKIKLNIRTNGKSNAAAAVANENMYMYENAEAVPAAATAALGAKNTANADVNESMYNNMPELERENVPAPAAAASTNAFGLENLD